MFQQGNADKRTQNKLWLAAFSKMLNFAEGSSRFTKIDKNNFYITARSPAFECEAIFDNLKEMGSILADVFKKDYSYLEEISKMV